MLCREARVNCQQFIKYLNFYNNLTFVVSKRDRECDATHYNTMFLNKTQGLTVKAQFRYTIVGWRFGCQQLSVSIVTAYKKPRLDEEEKS